MFDNIGGKIKTLAVVVCVVGMIASLIFAIVLWSMDSYRTPTVALGFGVLIGGCVVSWVGSFFSYGFGELIEETTLNRQINQQILQRLGHDGGKETEKPVVAQDVPVAFSRERAPQRYARTVAPQNIAERWKCAKCGTMNDRATIMCKDCGTYK